MEPPAGEVRRRQHDTPLVPAMGPGRGARGTVGGPARRVRRTRRRRLALASSRLLPREEPNERRQTRAKPDRPPQGRRQEEPPRRAFRRSARRRGCRRQRQRPQTPRGNDQRDRRRPPRRANLPAEPLSRQGLRQQDRTWNRQGGRIRTAHQTYPRRATRQTRAQTLSRAPLGGRTHPLVAAKVPRDPDSLGQEVSELPRAAPARLRSPLVSAPRQAHTPRRHGNNVKLQLWQEVRSAAGAALIAA